MSFPNRPKNILCHNACLLVLSSSKCFIYLYGCSTTRDIESIPASLLMTTRYPCTFMLLLCYYGLTYRPMNAVVREKPLISLRTVGPLLLQGSGRKRRPRFAVCTYRQGPMPSVASQGRQPTPPNFAIL
jgi:hypothetical protein